MSNASTSAAGFRRPAQPARCRRVPRGYQRHEITEGAKTWRILLNQQHGVELNDLTSTFDLVWASSWEHGANRLLGPLLGLPELPTILWPDRAPVRRGSWKAPYIAEWVGDRPFAWVDDEVGQPEQERFPGQLILPVDAAVGLTAEHFAALRSWARKPFADKGFPRHS